MAFRNLIWLLLLLAPLGFAAENADYLIAANPLAYTILNKYEQPLSSTEKARFAPYSPLQVISDKTVLGDQLSTALKVKYGPETYFLVRDDAGSLIGDKVNPYKKVFPKCAVTNDTIAVAKNRILTLSETYPSNGKRVSITGGTVLIRMFKYGDRYYLKQEGIKPVFGWASLLPKDFVSASLQQISAGGDTLTPMVREQIINRMQDANQSYRSLFEYFNTLTGQQKSIPQWRIAESGSEMIFSLTGPYNIGPQLASSTRIIAQELENLLIGKPFVVENGESEIRIAPKAR
jgi:hypothetical protein